MGSFELLSKTAPIQTISLIILGPFIDFYLNGKILTQYRFSTGAVVSAPPAHLRLSHAQPGAAGSSGSVGGGRCSSCSRARWRCSAT